MGNYLAAGLLGGAGLALLGAHHRANVLNRYDNSLNAQLVQQGAQPLNFEHRNFVFKSDADTAANHQKLYDDALKAHQQQTLLNDFNNQGAQYGLQHFSNPAAAEKLVSPYTSKDAEFKIQGQYGPGAAQGALELRNMFQNQNNAPPSMPQADPNEPVLIDPNAPIQASLSQQQAPQFSPGAYITPDLVKAAQANAVAQQNADATTRNAETNAGGLALRQKQYDTIQAPESRAKLQKTQQEIQSLSIRNSKLGALLQSQINRNNRPPSAGHPTSSQEFEAALAQGIKSGYWTPAEALKARKIKIGLLARPFDDGTGTGGGGKWTDTPNPSPSPKPAGVPGTKRNWDI